MACAFPERTIEFSEVDQFIKETSFQYFCLCKKESLGGLIFKKKGELFECKDSILGICQCLPTNCRRADKRLRVSINNYMKVRCAKTFSDEKARCIVFHSRVDLEENNPIVHCMKELNFNKWYIEQWLKGVNFTVTVFRDYSSASFNTRLGSYTKQY